MQVFQRLNNLGCIEASYVFTESPKLQTVVTWVLDELERNQKKENHLNIISKMMGTLVQVQLYTFSSRMALYGSGGEVVFTH